jgi:heme/copper-type cytochrome/quinol oxidase subunit 2
MRKRSSLLLIVVLGAALLYRNRHRTSLQRIRANVRACLFRHYWVLISLLLTIIATVVLLVETQTISYFADRAADPTTSSDDLRALGSTLVHSVGGTVVLLVILVLNMYKPRGMTRYGWRKQNEQRKASQP